MYPDPNIPPYGKALLISPITRGYLWVILKNNLIWLVLSDEQMSKRWPFSLLNDEQMSNWLGVEHQPVIHLSVFVWFSTRIGLGICGPSCIQLDSYESRWTHRLRSFQVLGPPKTKNTSAILIHTHILYIYIYLCT